MKSVKRVVFYFIYSVQLFVFVGDLVVEVFGDCLSDSLSKREIIRYLLT